MSGIRDHAIDWARQRHVVEAQDMAGLSPAGQTLEGTATTAVLAEVGTSGIIGAHFTAADAVVRDWRAIPSHWDLRKPIGVTLQWGTVSVTADDSIHFLARYRGLGPDEAMRLRRVIKPLILLSRHRPSARMLRPLLSARRDVSRFPAAPSR